MRLSSGIGSFRSLFRRTPRAAKARLTTRAGHAAGAVGWGGGFFERLENRAMLAGTPLPTLDMLESPNNSVVRFETSLGDIDIELFNAATPNTVANFLNYTNTGRYDESFFHRSAHEEPNGTVVNPGNARPTMPRDQRFVLQGGGFLFDDRRSPELRPITTDAPIDQEGVPRSNLERTLAMARLGSQPDSATSQFFVNLGDNSFLDTVDGAGNGFTVFARVIQGWDVVLAISDLQRWNLSNNASFTSDTTGSSGAMTEVPVRNGYSGGPLTNDNAVYIVNAEVVKPANFAAFYANEALFPDGFRGGSSVETLDLVNPNGVQTSYQIIARYETGIRDTVISTGLLNAGASLRIPVSNLADSSLNIVRSFTPYSLVVQSAVLAGETNPRPVGASISRFDFGAQTQESFFDRTSASTSDEQSWHFARIERNALSMEFVVWQNLSDQAATVTVNFFTTSGQQATSATFNLDAYRRGGIEVFSMGLPDGTYAVRVASTRPIVASMADWDIPTPGTQPQAASTPGWSDVGTPGLGGLIGALGDGQRRNGWSSFVSFFNDTDSPANVTISLVREGQSPVEQAQVVFPRSRLDVDLDVIGTSIPVDTRFAMRWESDIALVGQYVAVNNATRNNIGADTDGLSTMMQSSVGSAASFAGAGLSDPSRAGTSLREVVSVYNPFIAGAVRGNFSFRLRYHFSDGTTIDSAIFAPGADNRIDVATDSLTDVMTKINSGNQYRSYSITVLGTVIDGVDASFDVAGVAQLTRVDSQAGTAITTGPMYTGTMRQLSDDFFREQGGT